MQLNGLKSWCFLLVICVGNCLPDGDLCRRMNGRKYYIDVGESGIISVENATSLTKAVDPAVANSQPQIPQRCSVELITCPSCHLEITIQKLAIPACSNDKSCRCDFLWIKESAYSKSGREYCGFKENGSLDLVYESKTKLVSVDFLYSGNYKEAFSLHFSAKKNVYISKGGYDYYQANSSGVITSPNFPGGYPSDYSAEFILQNVDLTGFVQLIFTDFQLSLWSYIEIFDSNGTRIDVYNGNTFRPPAIISSGPTLTVKFQANDEYPSTGFQAKYTFVSYLEKYWINRPSTDCGGFVEDFGGAITMMNMVPSNTLRAFDCIWLIRPRNSHIPETQVSIRVAQFEEMGPKSTLTIRQGQHSDAPLLESVTTFQHHKMPRGQEFVVPATSGFYIRLIGYFTNKSHLAIIYTTFRYEGCYGAADFECENGRCIKNALRCDGFNHCGDGSDEASCYGVNPGTAIPEDANWWRTLTPNYYFPKPESSSGAGTNTLILVTSLAGLGMFVLTTIMILVKLHRQRHEDSISREILHTVSGDIDMENNSPNHQGGSDLPLYDPPPSYEDVIKLYLPPPPPYSTINRAHPRPSRSRNGGVDNRGYRNDSPGGVRVHARRSRGSHQARIAPQDNLHPLILKVSLPEESLGIPILSSRNNNICDTVVGSSPNVLTLSSVSEQDQKGGESVNGKLDNVQESEEKNGIHVLGASKQSNSSLPNPTAGLENDSAETCECEGACSCKLISSRKQIAISPCSTESKPASGIVGSSKTHFLKSDKAAVSKKRSFKDMMQKGINRASPSAIIPHPASMTITMLPPRSRKDDGHSKSKSVGPSSPTEVNTPPPEYESDNSDNGQKFNFMLGHRRSSSGPSDISASLNCISNIPAKSDANSSQKSSSESQISADLPPLSQAKYLAAVLLDGLQQSFSFKNDDNIIAGNQSATSKEDDKSIVPVTWTNLLLPVRKRPLDLKDLSQNATPEKSWAASDTHPLLLNGSPKTSIVKLDEKMTPVKSTSSQTQNFPDGDK